MQLLLLIFMQLISTNKADEKIPLLTKESQLIRLEVYINHSRGQTKFILNPSS